MSNLGKLQVLYTREVLSNIRVNERKKEATVDFHGMKAKEAHMLMNNLLAFSGERDMGLRRINAIHGYNRGTAIKQAIHERFQNHPMVEYMGCPAHNPGETVFLLKTA